MNAKTAYVALFVLAAGCGPADESLDETTNRDDALDAPISDG